MRIAAFVSLVILLAARSEAVATTIVVIRSPHEVVLAADSQATYEGGEAPENVGPVSKIYEVGELFFAVSGLAEDPETQFSVSEIVADASRGLATVTEKVRAIEHRIAAALSVEVPAIKQRDPDLYAKLAGGQPVISLVLVGAEKGVPFAKGIMFTVDSVMENSCPGNCLFGVKTLWLGQSDAIGKYMEKHRIPRKPFADFARFLIQLEIDSKAEGVEGPIDILRITPDGPEWIQRKPDCPHMLP
jgi:hypothetical protein